MAWSIKLIKKPVPNNFKGNFFPRKFLYKKDAENFCKEITVNKGEAIVEKWIGYSGSILDYDRMEG